MIGADPDRSELDSLLVRRLGLGQLIVADLLLTSAYTGLLVLETLTRPGPARGAAAWVLIALIGLPAGGRRLWPRTVLTVVLAASLTAVALDVVREPLLAAAFALYEVAQRPPRRTRMPLTALACGTIVLLGLLTVAGTPTPVRAGTALLLAGVGAMAASWALGRTVRARRLYAARYADQLAEAAVFAERLRIARDLHDVVTHSLGLIAVKAGVANHVIESRPEEATSALAVIESTSREALTEMRRMLGVLREDQEPPPLPAATGLSDLPDLVARARAVGTRVDLHLTGTATVSEGVQSAVYRIVQEALTNVVTHAPGARCTVRVDRSDTRVRVVVTDDGPGAGRPVAGGGGHGLAGMRERVAALGGWFSAGSGSVMGSGAGFQVCAVLPGVPGTEPSGVR